MYRYVCHCVPLCVSLCITVCHYVAVGHADPHDHHISSSIGRFSTWLCKVVSSRAVIYAHHMAINLLWPWLPGRTAQCKRICEACSRSDRKVFFCLSPRPYPWPGEKQFDPLNQSLSIMGGEGVGGGAPTSMLGQLYSRSICLCCDGSLAPEDVSVSHFFNCSLRDETRSCPPTPVGDLPPPPGNAPPVIPCIPNRDHCRSLWWWPGRADLIQGIYRKKR